MVRLMLLKYQNCEDADVTSALCGFRYAVCLHILCSVGDPDYLNSDPDAGLFAGA